MFNKLMGMFQQQQEAAHDEEAATDLPPPRAAEGGGGHVEWVVAFCLAFAAQPIQNMSYSPPAAAAKMYGEVGLGLIICSFACLFLSKYKCFDRLYPRSCRAMQQVGLFLAVTAFFMGTTYQCSAWLKCTGWTVYVITWVSIFIFSKIYGTLLS